MSSPHSQLPYFLDKPLILHLTVWLSTSCAGGGAVGLTVFPAGGFRENLPPGWQAVRHSKV
jgi:hypothetical protein